jgi:ABC-type Mn2+/Zn2+ transport system ATPase subunit
MIVINVDLYRNDKLTTYLTEDNEKKCTTLTFQADVSIIQAAVTTTTTITTTTITTTTITTINTTTAVAAAAAAAAAAPFVCR